MAGTAVTCAVSGGADSLALLVLAVASGCVVTAVHVDHGLRTGSGAEADVVAAAAARFGARFRSERVHVGPGPNLEARARAARYAVLPTDVLTGHTADDQAETLLLNLLRGSGLDGAAAMRTDRHPLLGLRRRETHALCEALGLEPVNDPTNDDRSLRRNRVRHDLVPLLDAIAERDVSALLAREAALIRDDVALLDDLASVLDPTDAKALAGAPVALARRAVRRWLADPYPPDADAVERVLAVARGDVIATEVSGGRRVSRSRSRLYLTQPVADAGHGPG
ncbi:MAG: tRNA lysidine(34) synthetase TilS [Acidimicrobiia bacterium]